MMRPKHYASVCSIQNALSSVWDLSLTLVGLAGGEPLTEPLSLAAVCGASRAREVAPLAIQQLRVGRWRGTSLKLERLEEREGRAMVPISNHERTKILLVVLGSRSVDDDWTRNAIGVLQTEVAVVPRGAILRGLEAVGHALTGHDRALGHTGHTVLVEALKLAETVPMN